MSLRDSFEKPVDRHIEGVIKADDESLLKLEIEEYVLTDEVARHLENFLDAYHSYEGANGVWISGFFGSGKSHLLKILSLILENREIDGTHALDLFLPNCKDNAILRAGLQKAATIASKSILFNIDQKADVISKVRIDALLGVFVKVFDEMCGYYGKQGYIAQFERDLDSRGKYADFKSAYREIAGQDWEFGREQVLLEGQNIAAAYAQVSGQATEATLSILDKYRKDYKLSIEDFANQVHAFVESQPSGFRLNFFVDEVGQYIAGNTKLMTNLQTIAESLAAKCHGRAWNAVTAQEEMDTVIGELDMQDGEDFSKIQDRFANRMKLTSAKVQEALNLLEQQTYIQRSGNLYEFLTDEEKDVEKEIKHTEVENADIAEDLSKSIFDQTLRTRKIRHEESGRDFPFSRKLDDRLLGREYELAIHVISPLNENAGREETLRMQSWGRDELLVVLPQDERLMQDLLMYKKTEKYVRQSISITQQEMINKLCGRGKIEVRANGGILEGADLEKAMRNTHGYGTVVLDPMVDFTASQLRRLKTFYEDFFDGPPKGREASFSCGPPGAAGSNPQPCRKALYILSDRTCHL